MRFIFLIYVKEDELTGLDQQALDNRTTSVVNFVTDLEKSGRAVAFISLDPSLSATVVRCLGEQEIVVTTTLSAFENNTQQLRWVLIVEATSEDEAGQLAGKLPVDSRTRIEVRPVTWSTD